MSEIQSPTATILTIGDELLIGQVVDTNSAWMARNLNAIGVTVKCRLSVGDNWEDIWQALDDSAKISPVVLITGGLGPTADDITKPLLCAYFAGQMVVNQMVVENLKNIFARLNRTLSERNLKQAEVPDVCQVINNKRGTAPGMWFEKEGTIFVSMPGVPHEMMGMMTDDVLPVIAQRFSLPQIIHRTLLTAGIGESDLADLVQPLEEKLPPFIKLAYLPHYNMVRLRLSTIANAENEAAVYIEEYFAALQQLVREFLVTNTDEPIEAVVAKLLLEKGKTLGTAESCTGGYLATQLTKMPGASAYFWGSVISYDNSVKQNMLKVSAEDLEQHGAVSEEVVMQMLLGALNALKTDYAIAVSGIMGPTGGSPDKPVGTVWIAVGSHQKSMSKKFFFRFDRQRNIELTAANALILFRELITEEA